MHNLFNECSNHATYKLQWTRTYQRQFAVYVFDTHSTLKQGHCHKTYNDYVDPEQVYNHEKFERSRFNGIREEINLNNIPNEKLCQLSPLDVWNIHDLHDVLNNPEKFQLYWKGT